MMEPLDLMLVGAALALSLTLLRKWLISSKRRLPLPPGPRGLPFFGNIFDLPKGVFWETYHEWATRYGTDIIYLDMLGSPAIIIDSYKAAHELVDLRSSNYASRPELPMMVDLMGFGWHVGFMPYGTKWREHRKIMHQYFETSYRLKFRPAISNITKTLLQNLLNDPDDFTDHMRLQAGSYIMFVAYGIDIKSRDDPHLQRAERAMYAMGQAGHGYIVDHFPSLKILPAWCPGAQFRVDARKWRPDIEDMANIPFEIAQGIARPCIATDLLEKVSHETDLDKVRHEEEKIRNILVSSYSVGSDTLVSPLLTFVLAMTMYPEVQRKAQAEIDKVLGGERLPEFSDFGKIPYIDAMLKELVRWKPTVPLGVQYSVIADDIYNGYHIPAGSTVYVNAWRGNAAR
ncbi:hypothetical protein NLJ89_g4348 [Agrocybe chaxingu]|uniref:Cytochrome P450 n=1 Tax=Agrocybe chaxingu TaxID=84603 RepID=A0A9W8MWL9_9AGAR|nr:hypothetical protein NLJ89_g4348 [Agrocybe chaxingu]